jgi:hypothetical protein
VSTSRSNSIGLDGAQAELHARCDTVEECYEFMLAYAAQGVAGDQHNSQVREFLRKMDGALAALSEFTARFTAESGADPAAAAYGGFMGVIDRDATSARAAVQVVLAQPAISSQLVDNLNASIHLRALITDLFIIDEALKHHAKAGSGE